MSFTSVLKKIGTVLLDGSAIATEVMGFPFVAQLIGGLAPKTQAVITTATSDLNTIASAISAAEVMFPSVAGATTGPAKLAAVTPLVQQALLTWATSNLPGHSTVKDPALLAKGAGEVSQGMVDVLNAFGA